MRFLKLTVAYDGGAFAGWQVQPGRRTVQGVFEAALREITDESIRAVASGRTDAGVHALGQVVSVATASRLPAETFRRALDANLPEDVVALEALDAPEGFHAIRDAVRKRYRYLIHDGPRPDVFVRGYAWRVRKPLDEAAMDAAAQRLRGEHDFASFEASGAPRKSSVRTVTDIRVRRLADPDSPRVVIEVEANGFLYKMVRNVVGALAEVGRGVRSPAWPAEILAVRDRSAGAATAPPHGLYLLKVHYPPEGPVTRTE